MRIVAVFCNVILFLFTCSVLLTDGVPSDFGYQVFTLMLLLVPILSVVTLFQRETDDRRRGLGLRTAAVLVNVLLLAASCWVTVSQYPGHPKEPGFVPYVIMVLLTPILTLLAIVIRTRKRPAQHPLAAPDA